MTISQTAILLSVSEMRVKSSFLAQMVLSPQKYFGIKLQICT